MENNTNRNFLQDIMTEAGQVRFIEQLKTDDTFRKNVDILIKLYVMTPLNGLDDEKVKAYTTMIQLRNIAMSKQTIVDRIMSFFNNIFHINRKMHIVRR